MEFEDYGMKRIREPFAAQIGFYPSQKLELSALIDHLLSGVERKSIDGRVVGCVVPHAGYQYSGKIAAGAYKQLQDKKYELIVIFGPPHRVYRQEPTFDTANAYETPLGKVEVDQKFIGDLVSETPLFSISRHPHTQEHSIEVQIPFLQSVLEDNFKIAPAVVGDMSFEQLNKASDILSKKLKNRNILLISSTDLSHYFRYDKAVELDKKAMEQMSKFDPEGLYKNVMMSETELCGAFGTILVMLTAKKLGAEKSIELEYKNSGDITGDKASVVGYGSVVFVSPERKKELVSESWLNEEEKKELLNLSRTVLESVLKKGEMPEYAPVSDSLYQERGCFVTLRTKQGRLRGCIGHIASDKPLFEVVKEMTVSAARQDPRFSPVEERELDELVIEISVLSPLEEIDSTDEIEIGKHGLLVKKGGSSGLLLPQVAVEWSFDREEFLRQTLFKAGLEPRDIDSPELKIYRFTSQVFSEEDL